MKIFILEDDQERINTFKAGLKNHELTIATSMDEAKDKFTGNYDLCLLDHDLGGQVYVNTANGNTGSEFVRWLPYDKIDKKRTIFIVHSYNIPAAQKMVNYLWHMDCNVSQVPYSKELIQAIDVVSKEKSND